MSSAVRSEGRSTGLAPIARGDARVLVLGSLPSERSIRAGEYYAHPQNAFWPIMRELFAATGGYPERCRALIDRRIAVWDVLASSVRPGSMDADIRLGSAMANDFSGFFRNHRDIELVCFNGRKAEAMFARFACADALPRRARSALLPSTSPAYASMRFAEKLDRWRQVMQDFSLAESTGHRRQEQ